MKHSRNNSLGNINAPRATTSTPSPTLNPSTDAGSFSSSYTSWTVPSLDSLYIARRASSALGARYGGWLSSSPNNTALAPAPAPVHAKGKISPAASVMSVMLEGGSHSITMLNKARKNSITSHLNDSSLVLYRMNEHIHKRIPTLVQEKKSLVEIRKNLETCNHDLEDAQHTISSMQQITELNSLEDLVGRALAAVQKR